MAESKSTLMRNFFLSALSLPNTASLSLNDLENRYYSFLMGGQKGDTGSLRVAYFKSLGYNSLSAYLASLGYTGALSKAEYLFYNNGPIVLPPPGGGSADLGSFDLGAKALGGV